MTFRPDRVKLNPHFEGYKLGKETLTCVSQPFSQDVRVARLGGDDFSYQHVRAFTLCNHLTMDPWSGNRVYWTSMDGSIMRGKYLRGGGLRVGVVFQYPQGLSSASPTVNPSLVFITPHYCLLTTGSSSSILLLYTPSHSTSDDAESKEEDNGSDQHWKLMKELKPPNVSCDETISIISAHYDDRNHQLHITTMTLHFPSTNSGGKDKEREKSKPPIATYNWYSYNIELTPSSNSPPSCGEGSDPDIVCSMHSSTIALYAAFISDHLIILSEADIKLVCQTTNQIEEEEVERPEADVIEKVLDQVQEQQKTTQSEDKKDEKIMKQLEQDEKDKDGETKEFAGLGFDPGKRTTSEEPQYKWTQTEGDISITIPVPDDVTKRDIHCVIDRRELVVGLSDGTTFLRGRLFAPVSPDCSTWTIDNHVVEVSLEKEREGKWASLIVKDEEEERVSGDLPLRGPVTDQLSSEEIEKLKKKVQEATREGPGEGGKDQLSLMQGMFYEECDMNDEDATFFITNGKTNPQKVSLAGRQFLFSSPSHPQTPPLICLRHDVDAVLWQPQAPPTTSNSLDSPDHASIEWAHIATFNALAYVQAARQDKKFTVCPPNMKFASLCDCNRHVFIYRQPEEGVKGNSASQYVTTLKSQEDILGLGATDSGLVFVLKEHELHVIIVD